MSAHAIPIAIYLAACTVVAFIGLRALYRMGRRTSHVRRAAFVLLTLGAALGYLEVVRGLTPMASSLFIVAGTSLLLLVGARGSRPRTHAPNSAFH